MGQLHEQTTMSKKKLSLFELHFHDSVQFGPRTLDGPDGVDETADEQPAELPSDDESLPLGEAPMEEDEGGSSLLRRFVGLGVLAAAAYAVRELLSGGPSGLDALDDIDAGIDAAAEEPGESEDSVSIEVAGGEESDSESSTGTGRTGLAVAVVLGLLVVLALAARKLLGDAVEEIEIADELAEE